MDEGFEKSDGQEIIKSKRLEVVDTRGVEAGNESIFKVKMTTEKIEEKLDRFENFVKNYKRENSGEVKINLVNGIFGDGQVKNGILEVNLPTEADIEANKDREDMQPFVRLVERSGSNYEDFVYGACVSTAMHESEHMIVDSRPGSKLENDFRGATGIENDGGGFTLSLLDEGIVYGYQYEVDSQSGVNQKMDEGKAEYEQEIGQKISGDSPVVAARKELGRRLRPEIRRYLLQGWQLDKSFLNIAGDRMKEVGIEKYILESQREKLEGLLPEIRDEKREGWSRFEVREYDNPTAVLEHLAVEGYCFHGSSRKIDEEIKPQKANDLIKESGNQEAVYMTINPMLAEFAGIYGGAEGITTRKNNCFMEMNDGKVSYPGRSFFGVNDPDLGVNEGYVYVFDRRTEGFEEINGEILAKKAIEPLMAIKIKKSELPMKVEKI